VTHALHFGLIGSLLLSATPSACAQIQLPKVEVKVKYICMSGRYWTSTNGGERHYCFDGKHYSRSTGGVPAFVLEYWDDKERESKEFAERMQKSREETREAREANKAAADRYRRAHGLRTAGEQERGAALPGSATLERSTKPPAEPVRPDLLKGIAPGAERASVIESLGHPHGAMSNLGAEGDEESLTYLVEGGGRVNIRLKQGKVLSVQLP
jgi:hypothetical protein